MKTMKLLLASAVAGSLLTGCLDLSSDEKEELKKSFGDLFNEAPADTNEEISTSDARDKEYLGDNVSVSDTTGNANLVGTVDASGLEDDTAQANSIRSRAIQARVIDDVSASDFTVYFINGKGQKEALNAGSYVVNVRESGGVIQYVIEGVGDGINYIIEVNVTVDGEDVNLSAVSFVPSGATSSPNTTVDPISTVITEAVQEKVVDGFFATGGETFSQDYIGDLKETLTAAVEAVIEANPELSATNFIDALESGEDGVDSLVTKLLTDDTIAGEVDKLESVAVEEKYEVPDTVSDAQQARDYIQQLFDELFGPEPGEGDEGGGAPQVFIDFFGDQYFAGSERTIAQVMNALSQGLAPEGGGASPFDAAAQTAALNSLKNDLSGIYTTLDAIEILENKDTLTEGEKEALFNNRQQIAEIPQMILGIFPPADAATVAAYDSNSIMSVPQAITLIFYVLDVYLDEGDSNDGANGGDDGDDFNPFKLLELYGFDPATDADQYSSLEVNWIGVHPGRMWISSSTGAGQEVDVLNVFTCVDAFPFEDQSGNPVYDISSVVLTYPTSTGTSTLNLVDESTYYPGEGGDGFGSCWVWDTWKEQQLLEESGNYDLQEGGTDYDAMATYLFDNGKIISDFTSGTYSIAVTYTKDGTASTDTFTFDKKVITGLQQLNPRFTTPTSEPRHPEGNVSEAEWQAYHQELQDFVPTTFPEGAIGTFQWDEPENLATSLPEGVIAAYSMDIGRNTNCQQDQTTGHHYCDWQHIFSTWENNTQIFATEFELPGYVKDQLVAIDPTSEPYNVHLNINFIDAETGEYLGQGGWSNARFYVGTPIDPTDTFTIGGSVTNVPNANFTDNQGVAYELADYKVALMEESCDQNSCTRSVVLNSAITDGTYSLMPSFAQAKGSVPGAWLNIIMYIDADGDGEFDEPTEANNFQGEHMFWSYNHVNFNTWGGILRLGYHNCNHTTGECNYYEEAAVPDGTYDGPDFDTEPMEHGADGTPQ